MDDESGESMELMEEMTLKELGEAELERLVRGWRRGPGVDSRDEAEHTGRIERSVIQVHHAMGCRGGAENAELSWFVVDE